MLSSDQLLARALNLLHRRRELLKKLPDTQRLSSEAKADAEISRVTSSLKLAVQTLLLAYQEEARNSPWYMAPAITREWRVETARKPFEAARSALKQGYDIIRDAKQVWQQKPTDDLLNAGLLAVALLNRGPIDFDEFADPSQRIAGRLRQLQYHLLNENLPVLEFSTDDKKADRSEILLAGDQGNGSVHSAWIEKWYDDATSRGLSLEDVVDVIGKWLPRIEKLTGKEEVTSAEAHAVALEQRVLAAARERVPDELRSFIAA